MRTALLSASFLEGSDPVGNDRFQRNLRFIRYYRENGPKLGIDQVFLFDNASSVDRCEALVEEAENAVLVHEGEYHEAKRMLWFKEFFPQPHLMVYRFNARLTHGPGQYEYHYVWRAMYAARMLIQMGYQKILFIDSDHFVLTNDLASWIQGLSTGWSAVWCSTWDFPESSLSVLCQDAFPMFMDYTSVPWSKRSGVCMETNLPFTRVEKGFRCGRFGEKGAPPQNELMDAYGQAPLGVDLQFGRFR